QIILDPFASPYRPTTRLKTRERQCAPITPQSPAPVSPTSLETASGAPTPLNQGFEFPLDFKQHTEQYEIELIQQALAASQYNQKKTAELLSLSYHQLRGILKKYNFLDKT
ncbi:MAG: helix-turn-helix domain-containing protein, partial [Shewanella sp.]